MGAVVKGSILKPLLRPIYHTLYRSLVRVRCQCADWRTGIHDLPPAMLRFRVSESISKERFVLTGRKCAGLIEGPARSGER